MNKRKRNMILTSVLTGVLVLCLTPAVSANESALDFRVVPAPSSEVSEGGDYFVLSTEPGGVETQAVDVSNPSTKPLTVRLAAVDAATAQMGGVDYGAEQLPTKATGSWISLDQELVELAPGASKEVAFQVAVPSDADSGVHLGGVVVWVEGAEQQQDAGAGATMNVQSRRVIAVQVDVPGPAAPLLEIRGAHAEARPDGLYLGIDLFNSGTDFASGSGAVSIEGRDGSETFALDTVVPQTGTNFPFRWSGAAVPNGSYDVAVEIDYGVAIATWQGQVSVGPAVQQDLRGRGVGEGAGSRLPLLISIGAALALLLVLLFLWRKRGHFSGLGSRLPAVSIPRSRRQPAPRLRTVPARRPRVVTPSPAVFVPRSEEEQRCVPPPPPPPPPARPAHKGPGYAGVASVSNFDY